MGYNRFLVIRTTGHDIATNEIINHLYKFSAVICPINNNTFALPFKNTVLTQDKEQVLMKTIKDSIQTTFKTKVLVGIADNLFAAIIAARLNKIVPKGKTSQFLSKLPVEILPEKEVVLLLKSVGVYTLEQFSTLNPIAVIERLDRAGKYCLDLVNGVIQPLNYLKAPTEYSCSLSIDPPANQISQIAAAVKYLANKLLNKLNNDHLITHQLILEIELEDLTKLSFKWISHSPFDQNLIAQRLLNQLEYTKINSAICYIKLIASSPVNPAKVKTSMFNKKEPSNEIKLRAFEQLATFFHPSVIFTSNYTAERHPIDMIKIQPAPFNYLDKIVEPQKPTNHYNNWPGRIPSPLPSVLYLTPLKASLKDAQNNTVIINKFGVLTSEPKLLIFNNTSHIIKSYSNPWTFNQLWWDQARIRHCVFIQVLTTDQLGLMMCFKDNSWTIEAVFD